MFRGLANTAPEMREPYRWNCGARRKVLLKKGLWMASEASAAAACPWRLSRSVRIAHMPQLSSVPSTQRCIPSHSSLGQSNRSFMSIHAMWRSSCRGHVFGGISRTWNAFVLFYFVFYRIKHAMHSNISKRFHLCRVSDRRVTLWILSSSRPVWSTVSLPRFDGGACMSGSTAQLIFRGLHTTSSWSIWTTQGWDMCQGWLASSGELYEGTSAAWRIILTRIPITTCICITRPLKFWGKFAGPEGFFHLLSVWGLASDA